MPTCPTGKNLGLETQFNELESSIIACREQARDSIEDPPYYADI